MGATTFHYGTLRVTDRGNFLLSLTIPLSKTASSNTVPRSFRNDNFPHVIESSTCVLHCSRSHAPPSRFSALLQNFRLGVTYIEANKDLSDQGCFFSLFVNFPWYLINEIVISIIFYLIRLNKTRIFARCYMYM